MSRRHRVAPVCLVEFADSGNGHELRLKMLCECDQAIHVPSSRARWAGPEVILLTHALHVRSNEEVERATDTIESAPRAHTDSQRPRRTTIHSSRPAPTHVRGLYFVRHRVPTL